MPKLRQWQSRAGATRPAHSNLSGPPLMIAVVVLALAVTVLGAVRLVTAFAAAEPPRPVAVTATLDGLTTQVSQAEWVFMDHGEQLPGFQMPPAMMPGMPTGDDQRLSVKLTLTNDSDRTLPLHPGEEFTLRSGDQRLTPHSDTFGELPRLAPHNAVTGILYFDVQPGFLANSTGWIEWTHSGEATGLALPLNGVTAPEHSHDG